MKKRAGIVIVAVAVTVAISTATVFAGRKRGGLAKLITDADTIVAVRILRTDYTATRGDGPMYGDTRVIKVIKGRLAKKSKLRFGESGWWSPTYKVGERRILFLKRVSSKGYYSSARWSTLYSSSTIDFFFAMDAIGAMSQASLEAFLKQIQEARRAPPKVKIKVLQKNESTLMLSLKLVNDSDQPLWLNPSRITAGFEANNIHYSRDIKFAEEKEGAWVKISPSGSITGTVTIASEEVKDTNRIILQVSHRSVYFPNRCWAGTVKSAPVQVPDLLRPLKSPGEAS